MNQDLPHIINERGLRVDIMPSYITISKLELDALYLLSAQIMLPIITKPSKLVKNNPIIFGSNMYANLCLRICAFVYCSTKV